MKKNNLYQNIDSLKKNNNLIKLSKELICKNWNNNWCITYAYPQIKNTLKVNKHQSLAFIPYDLKDNIVTKNIKTTAGSRILLNYMPSYNATVYDKLIAAGGVLMSKSNLDELGLGGIGHNEHFKQNINPFNKDHVTGGSSGGAAGLVSSGSVAFAIGTDTGDSIRIPAAYCGIVGFKPSWGRISRYGVIPYSPSLDTVGILSSSVWNVVKVFDVINGYDDKDLTSICEENKNYSNLLKKINFKIKKIVIWKNISDKIINLEYKKKFDDLIKLLKNNGFIFEEINVDMSLLNIINFVYKIISNSETISCCSNLTGNTFGNQINGKTWKEIFTNTRSYGFSRRTKKRFLLGLYATEQENQLHFYQQAQRMRNKINDYYGEIFKKYDCILAPCAVNGAPKIKDVQHITVFNKKGNIFNDNLLFSNMNGSPSITLPFNYLKSGLPISFSLSTKRFNDLECLQFALEIEKIIGFKNKLHYLDCDTNE